MPRRAGRPAPSRPAWPSGCAPNRLCARRKLSASAMCTQVSKCGSDAAYGRPSGATPVTRRWIFLTLLIVSWASLARPNVVTARK